MNPGNPNDGSPSDPAHLLDEAEALIWALLDDHLEEVDLSRLSKLIEEHAEVRARYIDCVQLHVDLREHFGQPAIAKNQAGGSVVLPDLFQGMPGMPGFSPAVD